MFKVLGRNGKLSLQVPRQAPVLTDSYLIFARRHDDEIEVELYLDDEPRPRLVDVGRWMFGGYVKWEREKTRPNFNALDAVDWVLRSLLPPELGVRVQFKASGLPFGTGARQSFNA